MGSFAWVECGPRKVSLGVNICKVFKNLLLIIIFIYYHAADAEDVYVIHEGSRFTRIVDFPGPNAAGYLDIWIQNLPRLSNPLSEKQVQCVGKAKAN